MYGALPETADHSVYGVFCRAAGGSTKFCAAQQLLQFQTPCENWCAPLLHSVLDVHASPCTLCYSMSALSNASITAYHCNMLQAWICCQ